MAQVVLSRKMRALENLNALNPEKRKPFSSAFKRHIALLTELEVGKEK